MFVLLEKMKVSNSKRKKKWHCVCFPYWKQFFIYVTGSVPLHYDEIFKMKVLDCVVSMALCFPQFFLIFWFAAKTFWHILSLTQKAGWLTVYHHSTTMCCFVHLHLSSLLPAVCTQWAYTEPWFLFITSCHLQKVKLNCENQWCQSIFTPM